MKKEIKKFLEFNGKSIHFLAIDGEYWIALKPICEALEVDYSNEIKKIEESVFLTKHLSEHTIVSADGIPQKMLCLPERIFYGWLFKIESDAPGLLEFKRECFTVLNNNPTTQSLASKIC
jgi:prophage antirepressor-like protein